ncbi:MAG: helix-turn-helix transcriptional regulator [Candidatus Omnitrophica bacterium]|nr:helix-turn-helix transcriptional regulator [Candidatus Omnitrophota bacterium]
MDTSQNISLEDVADILRSIAHPDRLQILMLLSENKELSVSEIQDAIGIKQSITSQHLTILKNRGVLVSRRSGNATLYSLTDKKVLQVIACISGCRRT